MIIQCIKCSTKFRFDESLMEMEGDGVWVRCSRCQEVFFQGNPVKAELREASVAAADMNALLPEPDEDFPDFDKTLGVSTSKEDIDAFLAKVEETKKTLEEHHEPETFVNIRKDIGKDVEPEAGGVEAVMKPVGTGDKESEPATLEAEVLSRKPEKRGFWSPWRIIALIVLINVLFGGIYLWFFSGMSGRAIQNLSSTVPFIGDLFGTRKGSGDFSLNQIQLQDLRQRFVSNSTAGNLRVIEGVAVNASSYPITRMQVKGELYDGNGVITTERFSYSGNLLSDDELATLPEETLQKELDLPMGSDAQNLRIEPKGQIPFMIIFFHEPPGIAKAKVAPSGGQKLLK